MRVRNITHLRIVYCALSALALSTGFLLYYCFRSGDMLIHQWFGFLPMNTAAVAFSRPSALIDFVRYNLPDGLWVLSGLLFLRALWHKQPKTLRVYQLCFLCIALLLETAQMFARVPGTFDVIDLVTIGAMALFDSIVHKEPILKLINHGGHGVPHGVTRRKKMKLGLLLDSSMCWQSAMFTNLTLHSI